jgi:hypothetical protein
LRIRHEGFAPSNATHSGILTSVRSSYPHGLAFTADRTLPYPLVRRTRITNNETTNNKDKE